MSICVDQTTAQHHYFFKNSDGKFDHKSYVIIILIN